MSEDRIDIILRRQRSLSIYGLLALAAVVCCALVIAAALFATWPIGGDAPRGTALAG